MHLAPTYHTMKQLPGFAYEFGNWTIGFIGVEANRYPLHPIALMSRNNVLSNYLNWAGKDIFWYAREKQDGSHQGVQDELNLVKAREEELMMEVIWVL